MVVVALPKGFANSVHVISCSHGLKLRHLVTRQDTNFLFSSFSLLEVVGRDVLKAAQDLLREVFQLRPSQKKYCFASETGACHACSHLPEIV